MTTRRAVLAGILMMGLAGVTAGCARKVVPPGDWGQAVGHEWVLRDIDGRDVLPEPPITVVFTSDGRVFGHTGSNRYFAPFQALPTGWLQLGTLGTTRMMFDASEELREQESRYMKTLATVNGYRVRGETLSLLDGDNVVLRYEKATIMESLDTQGSK